MRDISGRLGSGSRGMNGFWEAATSWRMFSKRREGFEEKYDLMLWAMISVKQSPESPKCWELRPIKSQPSENHLKRWKHGRFYVSVRI